MTVGDRIRRRILQAVLPDVALEDAGGLPWESIYPAAPPPAIRAPATAPQRFRTVAVASSATSPVVIALENPARVSLTIHNNGSGALGRMHVKLGYGASTSFATYRIPQFGTLVLEGPDVWRGVVTAAWDAGSAGNAWVTEL